MRRFPDKIDDLMNKIKKCIEGGRYLDTTHALVRQNLRKITRPEILYVLKSGFHEKRKDKFEENLNSWNYAIRGRTLDKKELRVIISFEINNMLIITAIDLGK